MELKLIKLINGDCLEHLKNIPDNSIDLVLTDPPYKIISGGVNTKKGAPSGICSRKDHMQLFKHNNLREELWFPLIYQKLKNNTHCYIMTNTLNLERYLTLARQSGFKTVN